MSPNRRPRKRKLSKQSKGNIGSNKRLKVTATTTNHNSTVTTVPVVSDYEALFTCSLCRKPFDANVHKPKFLSCFHTFCVVCVKPIIRGAKVSCPTCRKETHTGANADDLSNNGYILCVMASEHHQNRMLNKNSTSIAPVTGAGLVIETQQQVSSAAPPAPPPVPPVPKLSYEAFRRIPFDDYLFGITFCQGNQNIGTVFVRPSSEFYRPFIRSFARFCQPKVAFECKIVKANPTSFATIELSNSLFKKEVPDVNTFDEDASEYDIADALDVGFFSYSYVNDEIVGFQLAFLMKPLNMINTVPNQYNIPSCSLFGQVIDGEGVMEVLSKKRKTERSGFKAWIDFQQSKDNDDTYDVDDDYGDGDGGSSGEDEYEDSGDENDDNTTAASYDDYDDDDDYDD